MTTETDAQPGDGALRPSDFLTGSQPDADVTETPQGESAEGEPTPEEEQEGATPESETEGTEEPKPRKGKTAEDRIRQTIGKLREKEREADYWRGVAEGRIATDKAEQKSQEVPHSAAPNPDDYEWGEADQRYMDAVLDFKVSQRLAQERERFSQEQQEKAAASELAELHQAWEGRLDTAREKYPDFDEVVIEGAANGEWPCSQLLSIGIKQSEVGNDIAYHLATNPAEAKRIFRLSDIEQAREFGRLEGKLMNATPPAKKVTNAPVPPGSLNRGSGGKFENSQAALYKKMLKEFR